MEDCNFKIDDLLLPIKVRFNQGVKDLLEELRQRLKLNPRNEKCQYTINNNLDTGFAEVIVFVSFIGKVSSTRKGKRVIEIFPLQNGNCNIVFGNTRTPDTKKDSLYKKYFDKKPFQVFDMVNEFEEFLGLKK